jgi:small subunit ribosomal protein S16
MLAIRLSRVGAKKNPHYRLVVLEKSAARDGRALEILGRYNPSPSPAEIAINRERVDYWVSRGAQVSATVAHLLRRQGERAAAAPVAAAEAAPAAAPAPAPSAAAAEPAAPAEA